MTDALIGEVPLTPKAPDPDAIGAPDRPPVIPILEERHLDLMTEQERADYVHALELQEARWDYHPRQQVAVDLMRTTVDVLLYGGAAGGGKTNLGCKHALDECLRVPGLSVIYFRTSYPELKRTAINLTLMNYPDGVGEYNRNDHVWTFHNDSRIEFAYLESDDDVFRYKSAEFDVIIMDEASEMSEFQFRYMLSRLRTTQVKRRLGARPHMLLMTNPEGRGVVWLKKYCVEPTGYGARVVTYRLEETEHDSELTVGFVPAKVTDNPHIDPGYLRMLNGLPEMKRKQLRDGDWDTFEGRFLPEFGDAHICKPFPIPKDWPRIRGFDHGWAHPTAMLWIAFDNTGTGYVYKEYVQAKRTVGEHVKAIEEANVERDDSGHEWSPKRLITYADSAMWQQTGASAFSIAHQYAQLGIPLRKSNKKRHDGWMRMREYLFIDPEDPEARPGIYIFDNCAETIHCLKNLATNKNDQDDCEKEADDPADALRYALMSRPRRAVVLRPDPYAHLDSASRRAAEMIDRLASKGRLRLRRDRMR